MSISERPYHYVVVCIDIPRKHQPVQAAHAAYEAGSAFGTYDRNGNMVMCQVPGEEHLIELSRNLAELDIDHVVFYEGDMGGRPTALATAPLPRSKRSPLRDLVLWR